MITKENSPDRAGAKIAGFAYVKESKDGHCSTCGKALTELICKKQRLIAHVCDNIFCYLFRSPQFYTELSVPDEQKPAKSCISALKPNYLPYLERKKRNYRLLRDNGVGSVEAARMTSDKQTRFYFEGKRMSERR